jgi:uncharacterized protein (TIGR03089 family)
LTTPAALWRAAVDSDPSRPFVTSYDEAGGRVELSFATIDNWISKTANLLVEEFSVEPGDRVALAAPVHWQSLAWLYACWVAGATPVLMGAPKWEEATVTVAGPRQLPAVVGHRSHDVVGLSLHPLGAPLGERPEGVMDYGVEVRGFGDHFAPIQPPEESLPGLEAAEGAPAADQGGLAEFARQRAEGWGLSDRDRVMIATDPEQEAVLDGPRATDLLACTAAGAALLLISDTVARTMPSLTSTERVAALLPSPGGTTPSVIDVTVLS